MTVPSREFGDFLVADGTEALLFFPEGEQFSFPFQIGCHVNVEPFFKILFPLWIVGVGLTLNFPMPLDGDAVCTEKVHFSDAFFVGKQPEEHPLAVVSGSEVFFL
jgi:hypothetical protein